MTRLMRAGTLALTLGFSTLALAQTANPDVKPETKDSTKKDGKAPAPDNTKTNKRDRASDAPTADQQKNNKSDVEVAAEIRRAVVADKGLSTYGHNIKIIVQDGKVTLKGPVHTDAEKTAIVAKATSVVGQANVTDQIEIKQ